MSEVQDAGAASEPSMEEILASIRKIIADEPVPATAADDVLELTQMVQDDGSVVELAPAPQPAEEPAMAPAEEIPPMPAAASAATPAPALDAALVAPAVAATASSSLAALASTVQMEKMAASSTSMTPMGNGMRTMEDMVTELMKPMLKEWLDQNLPGVVDRMVQKEIERITKKDS